MQNDNNGDEEPFNPYKEAKRTGKSLEEVIREHEKKAKKNAGKGAKAEEELTEADGYFRVKRPRPISEAGSEYKTGRKAIAEEKAKKEAEARAKRKKEGYSKKKGGKKKGGKK